MEHFALIESLCRVALSNPTPAVRKQVERLRDALKQSGDSRSAAALSSILTASERAEEMSPSRLTRSKNIAIGEKLTPNTVLPTDKETGTPLAQIVFPENTAAPLFNERVTGAVRSLVEEWSHLDALEAIDVKPAKTLLIYGAPGTGKTRLAMWMATQLDLPVVVARLDSLVSSFLGTSSRNIGNLFTFANRYRCLLLLDEFDSLAKLRDDPQEIGEIKRIVNTLLQNLDARQNIGFTIGITNHPQLLDSAVWRRFEAQLEVPRPDVQMRLNMAHAFMTPTTAPESHVKLLAWFTEGATGAELESFVRAYKKALAVNGQEGAEIIELFRKFATLNSGRLTEERRHLLFGDEESFVSAIKQDERLSFSHVEIGEIIGKNKSTVSRLLNKKANEHGEPGSNHP
jgi:SpoVK/Ycf46/Vps4 family AAA+-type ATPase